MGERESIQREDVVGLEDFLNRHKKTLVQGHVTMLEVKKQLSVAYGRYSGYELSSLSLDKLKKKVSYCREVLEAITILEPGISTQKGLTLYEEWRGEKELAERLRADNKLDTEEYRNKLEQALKSLEEAAMIMRYEPENSLHGKVSHEIDQNLEVERKRVKCI